MKLSALLPLLLLTAACSHPPAAVASADTVEVEKMPIALPTEDAPRAEGRQPGEFVVVRISGAHRAEPVSVRQEVLERDGDEIVVAVSVDGERRLRLRIDDHPRRRGHVLAAWTIHGEEASTAPLSAYDQLMADLYMAAEANDGLVDREEREVTVGSTELSATDSTYSVWVGDQHATMRRVVATDFPWGELEFELRSDDDAVLFRAAVVEHGQGEPVVAGLADKR